MINLFKKIWLTCRFETARPIVGSLLIALLIGASLGCSSSSTDGLKPSKNDVSNLKLPDFVYYSRDHFRSIRDEIRSNNPEYVSALNAIIEKADKAVQQPLDSVMNKPLAGPSGDKHDYLSISPYFWPDPSKADGMPWEYKDGQINPMTRGVNTDQQRSSRFLKDLKTLAIAYSYTGNTLYAEKMQAQLNNWLVNPDTKMNPHLNYAQGMPGRNEGSSFGIIEWAGISHVVTAMQLLKANSVLEPAFITEVDTWLSDYLAWLLESDLGIHERTRKNNHGPWYDYQVVGLMLYLGQNEQAHTYLSDITQARIEAHFSADGSQPYELNRTKSVNYASMNLQALVNLAYLSTKVELNLWEYKGELGQSLQLGVNYFTPYLRNEKKWEYRQISSTIEEAYLKKTYPMLHVTRAFFGEDTSPDDIYTKVWPALAPELLLLYKAN